MKKIAKNLLVLVVLLSMVVSPLNAYAAQTVKKDYPLSKGIQYKQYTYKDTYTNSINHIEIDLDKPDTEVQLGMPATVNGRESTVANANRNSREGNRVVGAINASFFDMSEGFPLFLLAKNNVIFNGGAVSNGSDQYMNVPTAFGISADGSGVIDYFDFDVTLSHKGTNYDMSGMNRARNIYESIVYTPQFYSKTTNTNEYGFEIVVDTGSPITENKFGQTLTGKVTKITPYGSKEKISIPPTGFVVSLQGGDWHSKLSQIALGDELSVNFSIDKQWQDAQFIMASGPYLVKDNKPYIMMSTSSQRGRAVVPRTVVATSNNGKKVHFITVDGKQKHSAGMNMVQLANYLVSLGVERAINLDGGGSTTMGIRNYGNNNVVLANIPSNSGNTQRLVSATLQAVSTAPTGKGRYIDYKNSTSNATLLEGASSSIAVKYVLDENYNALPLDGHLSLTSENNTLNVNGLSYTATKAGNDRIFINHDGTAVQSFQVKVVDAPAAMNIAPTSKTVNSGETVKFTMDAKDDGGKPLVYNPSQVKWSVEGNIGTITNDGKFTAKNPGATGNVVATLGTKSVKAPVTVAAAGLFKDIPNNYVYYKEIEYLTKNNIITGQADGTFRPNDKLTRAHAAVIISRALGLDTSNVKNPGFKDIPANHVYYKQIAAVVEAGIMSGKGGNTFDPNGTLTRAQMAKVVALAYDLEGTSNINFKDVSKDHWAYPYVQQLAANDITTGYGDNTFRPNEAISRAHFGLFLYRAIHQ
ncbi:S-layer homology domain-containing protein [Lysinibacillus sp. fls2-241-R2A-57]|uniref:S-layer homology domain-containing protein n=1 Tax=Lysinibacillus sp. fls2-241-R2A-57 TaxID=3040292 RepID=UPI0025552FDD|nr:S-layer homology domain-containing protein [Lysinibacillus sp. fls2-241-R2A-57]